MSGLIEVELKAKVSDVDHVRAELERLASGIDETYHDTYYDLPDETLTARDQELRVRTVTNDSGSRSLLTFKTAPVETASGSRPEHETEMTDPAVADTVLKALGAVELISFRKLCRNHRFEAEGREFLATLVEVPEIEGTYLEVETLAPTDDVEAGLGTIRTVLAKLGISDGDLTTETYTGAVAAARQRGVG
ncbi:class IV adenylate cyclase [Nocardioides luteus]|uniref:Adenylyl cyclase n=1 Tax=Nocardioides luteus TaxID=1844 RepID=A0A1J4MZ56_9ACTN|nr:CYTH domain-containing protein [Nocardioides luteus]OIJ23951.1 adenylyl cyclase [Nocardioides luteus]